MTFHHRNIERRDEPAGGAPADDPIALATRAVGELREAVETRATALERRQAEEIRALTARVEAAEVRAQRPHQGGAAQPTVEQRAFTSYIRRGVERVPADEVRALRVADDTVGGYLAPDQFSAEIIRNLVQFSPVRAAARVGSMSAANIRIPKRLQNVQAQWVGEIEQRPQTQPAYGQVDVTAHELACYVDVSNQLLEDSAFDIAGELSFDFGEEFARAEGAAFIAGNGVKKPEGILFDPAVPVVQNVDGTGNPNHLALYQDSLINTMYSLPMYYRNRGSWMMSGPTIGQVRLLKDAVGRFLWQEGIEAGTPPLLLGRPVIEAVDMPDVAPGATPILFGDIGSAYRIYDRVGTSVLRDPFTMATYGLTRFHARRRVGAAVTLAEAIRKLVI